MIVLTITSVETVSGGGRGGERGEWGFRLKGALSMTVCQAAELSQLAEGC